MEGNPALEASEACEEEAYDLILGDAGKVFDLTQEKNELRERYGRRSFGQSCLLARRMVERGVHSSSSAGIWVCGSARTLPSKRSTACARVSRE
jgi:hypothetical protein